MNEHSHMNGGGAQPNGAPPRRTIGLWMATVPRGRQHDRLTVCAPRARDIVQRRGARVDCRRVGGVPLEDGELLRERELERVEAAQAELLGAAHDGRGRGLRERGDPRSPRSRRSS
jgi:hypothetical protein